MTTEKQNSRSANEGKARLSLGTSSTLQISPREAVARWNDNAAAAGSTGEESMVVDGQAEHLPAGDRQEQIVAVDKGGPSEAPLPPKSPNDNKNDNNNTNKNNTNKNNTNKNYKDDDGDKNNRDDDGDKKKNNNDNKRPLEESDAQAEEAEAERKQCDAARLLTKSKLRAICNPQHEPSFAHWPPPSRVRPCREQIIEKLRSVPPPARLAPDDVADADLADDQWRKCDVDLDSEAFARNLGNFGKPQARIPIVIKSPQSSTFSLDRRTDADIEGLARHMREYLGPPIGRPAEEHRAYAAMMEVCPPRPGVVPGLLASADKKGLSVADRRRKAAIDRVRAERDAAALREREAEEKAAAESAVASAARQ